jgi:deoxyribodipyrimidine photolyase-like uncharacterized protein
MPKQTFDLSGQASVMLKQYREKLKAKGSRVTYNDIVSEAIKSYCLLEQQDRADEIFEKTMEHRFQKYESRLASMVAAVGVDVCMILNETLEDRAALEENGNKDPRQVYSELREAGVSLFNRHKAFKTDVLK